MIRMGFAVNDDLQVGVAAWQVVGQAEMRHQNVAAAENVRRFANYRVLRRNWLAACKDVVAEPMLLDDRDAERLAGEHGASDLLTTTFATSGWTIGLGFRLIIFTIGATIILQSAKSSGAARSRSARRCSDGRTISIDGASNRDTCKSGRAFKLPGERSARATTHSP